MSQAIILTANNVKKKYDSLQVLKGIDLQVKKGEIISKGVTTGPGKSTLIHILGNIDEADSGNIVIGDENISLLKEKKLSAFRHQHLGFVFQFHHLLPELSALENILMPSLKLKYGPDKKPFAMELLREFGLESKTNSLPSQLSGGEQQRVAIARAVVMKPAYLFADEPTGNLDSVNGELVMNLFKRINNEYGTTIVYVTHDKEFASLASRQIHLVDGQIAGS